MSKKYLAIGDHGFSGDFYKCDGGSAFRADNLLIATKIGFNNWLREFDNLNRECTLSQLIEGEFIVSIFDYSLGGISKTETHTVSYFGSGDMFTAESLFKIASGQKWFSDIYAQMIEMNNSGDTRVRLSKATGLVIFNIGFPRYDKNGDWWSQENNYLSDNQELANQQWEYVCATEEERNKIAQRNYSKMREHPTTIYTLPQVA